VVVAAPQRYPFYFFADIRITCEDGSVHSRAMLDYVRAYDRNEAEQHYRGVIESLLDVEDEPLNLPSGIANFEINALEWMT
jgi:hypothetical protein